MPPTLPSEPAVSALLSQFPVACWASRGRDYGYEVVLWNDAAAETYGIPASDALGARFTSLFVAPEARAQAEADADAVITSGHHPANTIAVDHRPDTGEALLLLTNVFRLEIDGVALHAEVSVDLSDSEELARYIDDQTRQQIFTSSMRTFEFLLADQWRAEHRAHIDRVASIAHEVRTELGIIRQSMDDARTGVHAPRTVDACERAGDYIETLLIHAKAARDGGLTAGRLGSSQLFIPNDVIQKVRARYSHTASPVNWTRQRNGNQSVRGDARDFELALSNLIGNAVRHSEGGSPINIYSHLVAPRRQRRGDAGTVAIVISNVPRAPLRTVAAALDAHGTPHGQPTDRFGLPVVQLLCEAANAHFKIRVEGLYVIAKLDWPVNSEVDP